MRWYHIEEGQFLFNRAGKGLLWWVRVLFYTLVYFPLLAAAYLIDMQFIPLTASGLVWLVAIVGTAALLYVLIFVLKGMIIGLRKNGSAWWIPLFVLCVVLTCVLPPYIAYSAFYYIARHNRIVSWMLTIALAYFIYGQYNFLNQKLPFFSHR